MQKLQDTADLFEVSFPDYKQLRQCRSDIILVKAVWDMVIFVKVHIYQTNKHVGISYLYLSSIDKPLTHGRQACVVWLSI